MIFPPMEPPSDQNFIVTAPSTGEVMLGSLLDDSHGLRPDELPAAVRCRGAFVGLEEATMYLVDKGQTMLVPLPKGDGEVLAVDASLPGQGFLKDEAVFGEEGATGHPVWFPLLDGRARLGMLHARVRTLDDLVLARGRQLAALAAELLLAKSAYGDNLVTANRLRRMSLAAEMRWSLLPPLTFVCRDVTVAGYMEPAYEIAGDAFDYAINGNTAHMAIFDARGHGLTASRMADLAAASYRHSRRSGLGIAETTKAMNEVIANEFGDEAFVTAQFANLDLPLGTLRWVNAGHPVPLLLRAGRRVSDLTGHIQLPVGLDGHTAKLNETTLEPGDIVAFYSDGVTEARSPDGEEFGRRRLADFLVRAARDRQSPAETVRRLPITSPNIKAL